jgi:hypothetical protein
MKGAAPLIIGLFIVVILVIAMIFDETEYFSREFEYSLSAKDAYSVVHQSELLKRSIDSSILFSAHKLIYQRTNFDVVPTKEELIYDIESRILAQTDFSTVEKLNDLDIEFGNLSLEIIDVTDESFTVKGNYSFFVGLKSDNFYINTDSPGEFSIVVKTDYFNLASAMSSLSCPIFPIESDRYELIKEEENNELTIRIVGKEINSFTNEPLELTSIFIC